MLSAEARPYIDLSVPVLREHGVTITRTFYRNMFAEYPEFTNLFNMGNQANGSQQQALAAAVFAYAANYGNAEALAPVVKRIVHKHVSVGITAEHYPIVGRHLLGAIEQTLGDAATPPLMAAWREAYGLLADTLISAEKALYAELQTQPGEFEAMRVIDVQVQGELVTSFTLQPENNLRKIDFKPGQYVTVAVNLGEGQRQLRQYSLSDAPGKDSLRISIKRQPEGAETPAGQVSNWLHDNLTVSSVLDVGVPVGEFTPDAEGTEPIVLLSAGIGITPMISVLNRIAQIHPQRTVIFGHATRDKANHAHRSDIEQAQKVMQNLRIVTFYERPEVEDLSETVRDGHMDITALGDWPRENTNVYLCGPLPFMQIQWQHLIQAGVPISRLHREIFGPEMLDHLL